MQRSITVLRKLRSGRSFINMPSPYDAITGQLIISTGISGSPHYLSKTDAVDDSRSAPPPEQ
jgi:hypothetical protein